MPWVSAAYLPLGSTSVWGSELKCIYPNHLDDLLRLPLCEVVSWNSDCAESSSFPIGLPLCEVVSWNTRSLAFSELTCTSTSVWGSELKCYFLSEIHHVNKSTSVWGSELKCPWCSRQVQLYGLPLCEVVSWNNSCAVSAGINYSLPLCEVVSWNVVPFTGLIDAPLSTSVWGSELKYDNWFSTYPFTGLPLCEVVSWNFHGYFQASTQQRLPLCEVVSWNIIMGKE